MLYYKYKKSIMALKGGEGYIWIRYILSSYMDSHCSDFWNN